MLLLVGEDKKLLNLSPRESRKPEVESGFLVSIAGGGLLLIIVFFSGLILVSGLFVVIVGGIVFFLR